jgi:hypothetical protein
MSLVLNSGRRACDRRSAACEFHTNARQHLEAAQDLAAGATSLPAVFFIIKG